jgi:hypothetical protein
VLHPGSMPAQLTILLVIGATFTAHLSASFGALSQAVGSCKNHVVSL